MFLPDADENLDSEQIRQSLPVTLLPDSVTAHADVLMVGGCSLAALARTYGTPLYVYDEITLRNQVRQVNRDFSPMQARVSFAAKACGLIRVLQVLEEEGLHLDVVSLGELEAGIRAGFPPSRIHLHGNCKSDAELEAAVHRQIHAVVVDNPDEISRLDDICKAQRSSVQVMLRISLPLEAETHPHLQTSGIRSKFGVYRESDDEERAWTALRKAQRLRLTGLHIHLGSQINDATLYTRAASEILALAEEVLPRERSLREISIGGGWAVAYAPTQTSLQPEVVAGAVAPAFEAHPAFLPAVEPGRAIVARAAVAIYRVGSIKRSGDVRIIAVDGGMGDNPRPALYGAEYHALHVQRPLAPAVGPSRIVGRYCESGDMLAYGVPLPEVDVGDFLCLPVAGAYQLSMASTYNLVPAPAAVMVKNGRSRLLCRRAGTEDLFRLQDAEEI